MRLAKDLVEDDAIHADREETMSSLIGKFEKSSLGDAFIFSDDVLEGVFSHFLLLKSSLDSPTIQVHKFLSPITGITEETDFITILKDMITSDATILPVIRNKKYLGSVSIFDVLANAREIPGLEKRRASEFARDIIGVRSSDSVSKAIQLMRESKLREIPIIDEAGALSGLITSVGLLERYYKELPMTDYGTRHEAKGFNANPILANKLPASNFSTKEPVIISPDMTIYALAEKMAAEDSLTAFYMDNGAYKWVTAKDILKELVNATKQEVQNIKFVGLDELSIDKQTKSKIHETASIYSRKYEYVVKRGYELVVHIKEHERGGKKHRYEYHIRINYPGDTLSIETENWDCVTGLQKGMDELENALRNQFRSNAKEFPSTSAVYEPAGLGTSRTEDDDDEIYM